MQKSPRVRIDAVRNAPSQAFGVLARNTPYKFCRLLNGHSLACDRNSDRLNSYFHSATPIIRSLHHY